jgi:hypothetical protein
MSAPVLKRKHQGLLMAPTKSPKLRLLHIRDEIDGLTAALAGVTFEAYGESYVLRRATERALADHFRGCEDLAR